MNMKERTENQDLEMVNRITPVILELRKRIWDKLVELDDQELQDWMTDYECDIVSSFLTVPNVEQTIQTCMEQDMKERPGINDKLSDRSIDQEDRPWHWIWYRLICADRE